MESEQKSSPIWSALSLAFPVFSLLIALMVRASSRGGSGNIEIFPAGVALVILSYLGFSIVGIILGIVGLAKGRWPIVAIAGILLSGWLLWCICMPH
jgi:hypothetical protein